MSGSIYLFWVALRVISRIHHNLFYRLKTASEELAHTQQSLLNKEELLAEKEKDIEESANACEKKSE